MAKLPIPFAERQRRLPTIGRIRMGEKSGKAMKALSCFRFTSQDREAIDQIAQLYGGMVRPWSDPKAAPNQFEVYTDASEIEVILPPGCLGDTPIYEKFGGRGLERRCDGVQCEKTVDGPEGPENATEACICARMGALQCKPQLRLSVILNKVRMTGAWRLDTKSEQACEEMPQMVELILEQQQRGLASAVLRLERRLSRGGRRKYIVPTLGVPATPEALVSGAARLQALPSQEMPALSSGVEEPRQPASPPDGDDVVDAEIVDELREAISGLAESQQNSLKGWWRDQGLSNIDDLDTGGRAYVLAYVRSMANA